MSRCATPEFRACLRCAARRTRARTSPRSMASTPCSSATSTCCFPAMILPGGPASTPRARNNSWQACGHGGPLRQPPRPHRFAARAGCGPLAGGGRRALRPGRSPGATQIGAVIALVDSDASVIEAGRGQRTPRRSAYVRAPVGRLATRLHTYLALIADDPTVQLVNDAQRAYAAPLAAARANLASLPILSASAPFKCGGRGGPDFYTDVAPGPIAIKDVADIDPYPNRVRVVKVDGATLREWLERSASIFRRIDPRARRAAADRSGVRLIQFRRGRRRRPTRST